MRAEVLLAFLAMAAVSYGIRVAGFLVGGRLHENPSLKAALDQLPAAILIALVVPSLARGGPAEWLAAVRGLGPVADGYDDADTRLGIAVMRGLLVDVLATGDVPAATAALERYLALADARASVG